MRPSRRLALVGLALLGALWAPPALAQRIFAYGPVGTSQERRVIAVVEGSDGACVPVSEPIAWSVPGGSVVEGPEGGGCARWLHIRVDRPTSHVLLRAHAGWSAYATIPLGGEGHLEVQARREGEAVIVTVPELGPDEPVSGVVVHEGGREPLSVEASGRLVGRAPPGELVAVLVRTDAMVGVGALPPARRIGEPRALVIAADLSIEAGGPPREAAFVVAADSRGRLTSELPLSVQSERGQLRSLRWFAPGVAAIGLAADVETRSVDLSVGHEGRPFAEEVIEVSAQWPVGAEVRVPATVASGEGFVVSASATSADGRPIPADALRARCGAGSYAELPLRCDGQAGPSETPVVVGALVDRRIVPLATVSVSVRPPPAPPPPPDPSPLQVGLYVRGAFDAWERAGGAAGLRGWVSVLGSLRIGLAAEHGITWLSTGPLEQGGGALSGERHSTSFLALAELSFGDVVAAAARLEVGGGWTRARFGLGDLEAEEDVGHLLARLAVGPRLRLAPVEVGLDVGAEVGTDTSHVAWDRAPVAGFVEVSGALRLP